MAMIDSTERGAPVVQQVDDNPTHRQAGISVPVDTQIICDAGLLSDQLPGLRQRLFPDAEQKHLRMFTSGEAARLIGVSDGYLRQLSLSGEGPQPSSISQTGRRSYTLEDVNELRRYLTQQKGAKAKNYLRRRRPEACEQLQILAVTNFKGDSGKTTTVTHYAQYMALQGYRVLAIDLDPQASMSTLFGYQPEMDLQPNTSIYGAIRQVSERAPLESLIRKTHFPGLDLVPGNLELQAFEHAVPSHLVLGQTARKVAVDELFFSRVRVAIETVADKYDVVILDCPPQLGFLTLSALFAATGIIITVHPRILEVASLSQFLTMISALLSGAREMGGEPNFSFLRYLVTQYEPSDALQTQIVAFLRAQLGERVLTAPMVESAAIASAGSNNQTLYEAGRESCARPAYDRAMESLTAVNSEIESLVTAAWGRTDR